MTAQPDPDWDGVLNPPRVPRPSEMSPINKLIDAADLITARTLAIEEIRDLIAGCRDMSQHVIPLDAIENILETHGLS